MGKKYLETKNKSLESSILGVWKTAIDEGDARDAAARMDGRTKGYREHRAKLEANRQRREARKVTKEEVELLNVTPSQIEEAFLLLDEQHTVLGEGTFTEEQCEIIKTLQEMTEEEHDELLEQMDDNQLEMYEGILGAIGKGIKKVAKRFGTKQGRASAKLKKAKKKHDLEKTKGDIQQTKIDTKAAKKARRQQAADQGIGVRGKAAKAGKAAADVAKTVGTKAVEKGKEVIQKHKDKKAADKDKTPPAADKDKTPPAADKDKGVGGPPEEDPKKKKKNGNGSSSTESFDPQKLPDMREALMQVWSMKLDEKHNGHDTHVDPKDREDLDTEPSDTAKKQKKAKEPAPNQMAEAQSGDKEAYKKFFDAALKKFKINSPADLKSDEEKKKFYDYIDKGWKGDNEKAEGAMSQVREFKIQAMKAALAQVWGMEEGKNPFKKEDDEKEVVKNGKTDTGKKAAVIDLKPKIKD